jgi:adenine deaminase
MKIEKYGGYIVDVVGNRIFKGEISVENGKIASIVEKDDVADCYIMPGLVDAHVHVESSMLTPSEFAHEAVKHGTVAVVSDPHEIANVLGMQGVRFMINNGKKVPLKFCFGAPSCVPATTFETSGATLDVQKVADLLAMSEIGYLSEVMNYPGVIYGDPAVHQKIAAAKQFGKPIDGHAPGVTGSDLQTYIAAGITTDHECFTFNEALEKLNLGMKILVREGSAAKNFDTLHTLIKTHPDNIMLCSDDLHPDDLVKGHINLLVIRALSMGYDLLSTLRTCTYNPVKHYNLPVGLLQVGDPADFMIVNNLTQFIIQKVFINGNRVAERGISYIEPVTEMPLNDFITSKITTIDIEVLPLASKIRVIDIVPNELITKQSILSVNVVNGKVESDLKNDVLKMVMLNRYQPAKPAVAFIRHSGLKAGAIASSVVHDSHNIICIGTNDLDMVTAINVLIEKKGGISASKAGITTVLPLPYGGLMDNRDAECIAKDYQQLNAKAKEMGATLNAPYMTLSFMGLLVIPELKLSDKGLFDGVKFEFTDLFVND